MKKIGINTVLLTLTIMVQVVMLYMMWHEKSGRPSARTPPPPVRDAAAGISIDVSGLPNQGGENASVYFIEFSDFECPFCKGFVSDQFKQMKEKYVSTGKVRYFFANHPLEMHKKARMFATAGICASRQGQFWKMHDSLFIQQPINKEAILSLAREAKLDTDLFGGCFDDQDHSAAATIDKDSKNAEALGLRGTPSFAIGRLDSGARQGTVVKIEKLITGAQPFQTFSHTIDAISRGGRLAAR